MPHAGGKPAELHRAERRAFALAKTSRHLVWVQYGHKKGECRKEYRGCGQNPMPPEIVCDGPAARILRLPLAR